MTDPKLLLRVFTLRLGLPLALAALALQGCGSSDEGLTDAGDSPTNNRAGGAGGAGKDNSEGGGAGSVSLSGAGGSSSAGKGGSGPTAGAAGSGQAGSTTAGAGGAGGGSEAPLPDTPACLACAAALCGDKNAAACACDPGPCASQCGGYAPCGAGANAGSGGSGAGGSLPGGAGVGGSDAGGGAGAGAGPSAEFDCSNGDDDNFDGVADCDDQACASACANPCAQPTELLAGDTRKGALAGHKKDAFLPSCAPTATVGPSLAYHYKAQAAGWLTLKASSPGDVILSAHQASCLAEGVYSQCRNQVGPGGQEQLTLEIEKAGDWFVLVTSASADESPSFDLTATFEVPVCGDGKLAKNEACDDGNKEDNDGCSATCTIDACSGAQPLADAAVLNAAAVPAATTLEGDTSKASSSALQPSCAKPGGKANEVVFSLRAANSGRLEVELTPEGGSDLVLSSWSTCAPSGEAFCVDAAGAGGVERLSVPAEAGQPFYLVVEGYGADQGAFTIQARTLPVACGDGVLVPSVEQCEKGADDKNCSADCTRLPDDGEAKEPGGAAALPPSGALGRVFPAGDVDLFVVEVPYDKKGVKLSVVDPTPAGDCQGRHLDSQLELLDPTGASVLAFNDDAPGQGSCSAIETQLAPGKYLVRLRASLHQAPAQVFSYRLVASFF